MLIKHEHETALRGISNMTRITRKHCDYNILQSFQVLKPIILNISEHNL